MAKYPGTLLPQTADPVEIQKGHLDLLSKINQTDSDLSGSLDSSNAAIAASNAAIAALQASQGNPGTTTVVQSTTWPKLKKSIIVLLNSASANLQNIMAGAANAGISIIFQNVNSGLGSINFDGTGNVAQLSQNAVAGFIWSGLQWNLLTPVSGSNANGQWTKYPDGTLEVRFISPTVLVTSAGNGSTGWRQSGTSTFTFPIPFVGSIPVVLPSCVGGTGSFLWVGISNGYPTLTQIRLVLLGSDPGGNTNNGELAYWATGRWL